VLPRQKRFFPPESKTRTNIASTKITHRSYTSRTPADQFKTQFFLATAIGRRKGSEHRKTFMTSYRKNFIAGGPPLLGAGWALRVLNMIMLFGESARPDFQGHASIGRLRFSLKSLANGLTIGSPISNLGVNIRADPNPSKIATTEDRVIIGGQGCKKAKTTVRNVEGLDRHVLTRRQREKTSPSKNDRRHSQGQAERDKRRKVTRAFGGQQRLSSMNFASWAERN